MASNTSPRSALRPLPAATTASADFSLRVATSTFQPSGEISPGKNALLHCTTAGSTPPRLDHKSFAVPCPLALLSSAFYPVLVHRLAVSLHASFPHSVTLMQLRFASFAVINLRRDLHPQECAHAGRTRGPTGRRPAGGFWPTGQSPIRLPSQVLTLNYGQWCCFAGRKAPEGIPCINQAPMAHCERSGEKSPRATASRRPPLTTNRYPHLFHAVE